LTDLVPSPSYGSNAALVTFLIYTLGVLFLAWMSNRLRKTKSFLSEYFLGSRSLGVWAFALTFAATSASGGSFTGFPSKIYTHGWILGLWIGSYIVVPICGMGLLGKRINQLARRTGAITIPDILRDRFESAGFGLLCTGMIIFFMSVNLVAQFKSGSLILKTLLLDVPFFRRSVLWVADVTQDLSFTQGVDPGYLLCLLTFAVAVILYTTYGGFHAVVWTDVMQGVVMVAGVVIMLPLALVAVGGLDSATQRMGRMVPPRLGVVDLELATPASQDTIIRSGVWLSASGDGGAPRLLRTSQEAVIPRGSIRAPEIQVVEIVSEEEAASIRERLAAGTLPAAPPSVSAKRIATDPYRYGADRPGVYVSGPGPDRYSDLGFLPLSLAFSFFFMWAISGTGQPGTMVRLMAFKGSGTLKRSIFTVAIYYSLIYFPLVIIFCCARIFLPGMELESDRIMPATAVFLSSFAGAPWMAGILVAAPFAAVMSTVDSFLLVISSALVRDVYQRNINPQAPERTIKRMSYVFTFVVGFAAVIGAVNPPQFLQDIIVYTGSGLASCFLAPVILGLYWPRINTWGAMSGMLGGFLFHLSLYGAGYLAYGRFSSYRLLGIDPVIWGLAISFFLVIAVSKATPPPPRHLVRRYFFKQQPES
jgi:Na+/pantothenate symporter